MKHLILELHNQATLLNISYSIKKKVTFIEYLVHLAEVVHIGTMPLGSLLLPPCASTEFYFCFYFLRFPFFTPSRLEEILYFCAFCDYPGIFHALIYQI